jgi:hypothetical protein
MKTGPWGHTSHSRVYIKCLVFSNKFDSLRFENKNFSTVWHSTAVVEKIFFFHYYTFGRAILNLGYTYPWGNASSLQGYMEF